MTRMKRNRTIRTRVSGSTPNYRKRRLGVLGGSALLIGGGLALSHLSGSSASSSSKSKGTGNGNSSDDGDGSDDGSGTGSGTGSGDGNVKSKVVEEIIDNYEEALEFANREWNKIKRDNGRQLDCQVLGSAKWETGDWIKVYLPSFDIDGYMYIIRSSQSSDGGDWTCNLSLVDYPPGWGKEELPSDDSDSDDSNDDSSSSSDDSSSSDGDESTSESNTETPKTDTVDGWDFYTGE